MLALHLKVSLAAILLAAIQAPPAAAPEKIELVVVDARGEPVEGADIFAMDASTLQAALRRPGASGEVLNSIEIVGLQGKPSKTDSKGRAHFDRTEPRMYFSASIDRRFAYGEAPEAGVRLLTLALAPDVDLDVQVVDATGAPRPDVPVALFQAPLGELSGFRPSLWRGRTRGADGRVKLRHLQEWTKSSGNVAPHFEIDLHVPTKTSHAVAIDPDAPPAMPVVLQLPKTGSVRVTMAEAPESWVEVRALPATILDDPTSGPGKFWFSGDCERVPFRQGEARFAFVELGLELQLRAYWKDAVAPAILTFPGPTREGEELTFEIDAQHGPGGLTVGEQDVVVLDGQQIVRPKELYLTSRSFENDAFDLCFVPADGGFDHNRQLDLRIGTSRPCGGGWHALDSVSETTTAGHFCFGRLERSQAELVSRRLKVPMALITKRPYELKTTCSLDKSEYPPRGSVQLRLNVENVGSSDFSAEFGGWQRGANRHGRFKFVITKDGKPLPDIGSSESWGGFCNQVKIESGKSFEEVANLSQWCAFDVAGTYDVEVRYELHIVATSIPFEGDGCAELSERCTDYLRARTQVVVR